jgi:hypothetical protein
MPSALHATQTSHSSLGCTSSSFRRRRLLLFFWPLVGSIILFAYSGVAHATIAVQREDGIYIVEGTSSYEIYSGEVEGFGVSPNGQEVVFTPIYPSEHWGDLMVYNLPEESTTVVSSREEEGMRWRQPRFAPSGKQIIAASDAGLYAIDPDGTHLRRLTGGKGEPSWPVMSPGGYLAYLDDENLWVLDPSEDEEASTPRLIATLSEHSATTAYPPSFGNEGGDSEECEAAIGDCEGTRAARATSSSSTDLLLYPTNKSNYIFNVETGEEQYAIGTIHKPEWDTLSMDSFWEAQFNKIYRVNRKTSVQFLEGETPEGEQSTIGGIRSDQPSGEVSIPHAPISEAELLFDFRPYVKYDSQEPYGAVEPSAITNLLGWNEDFTEVLYTNSLKRGGRILAQPAYEEWMEEEGIKYSPKGVFSLSLESIGSTYPTYAPPDESADAEEEDYIDEHNDTHEKDSDGWYSRGNDFAAGLTRPAEDGLWLEYWFFFYYNNGTLGVDDHEGDWEMIAEHLNGKTGYLPTEVIYSQHSHANACARGEYETEGQAPGPGGSPVVYIANGDHALYPEEGEWYSEFAPVHDSIYPDLEEWPSSEVRFSNFNEGTELFEAGGWLNWPGEWGGSENSPRGPEFHESWEDPTTWAEEAQGCYDNKVAEFEERSSRTDTGGARQGLLVHIGRIERTGVHVKVAYTLSGPMDGRPSWPRMLVSAGRRNGKSAPRAVIISHLKRSGKIRVPFRLNPKATWKLSLSVVSKHARTRPIARTIRRVRR